MSNQIVEAVEVLRGRIGNVYSELDHLRWELNRIEEMAGKAPPLPTDADLFEARNGGTVKLSVEAGNLSQAKAA